MQITVTCVCSREMKPRAIPKGTFRCGCGAGVRVVAHEAETIRCAAAGCDLAAERTEVVPLCGAHVQEMTLALLPDTYANYPPSSWVRAGREYKTTFDSEPNKPDWLVRLDSAPAVHPAELGPRKHEPVVYFALVGDQVKIGTTTNLIERFMAINLPPGAVIHTIPGSYEVEKSYHRRFAAERTPRTEWFRLSSRLRSHIEDLVQSGEATCPDSVTQLSTRSFRSTG
ncbi:GIY-YIG nuclease family protein [Dactylosporangium roseum]|uniref:GIY-YIG nuclease family protein n=1 Tax=Dactylosporangium roseum TaxID=47989 RepID=A0ABY5Z7Q0_9ACTN|nr:GIY-YIG nuclease family protein [Dactylosporangium roseum]UWZ37877.1 GIY-YIG nuclease family protein [Dactylosporangium roseum]